MGRRGGTTQLGWVNDGDGIRRRLERQRRWATVRPWVVSGALVAVGFLAGLLVGGVL